MSGLNQSGEHADGSSHLEVLSGWKDVANYLGKGVRTVQRYERQLGLPVRRPSSKAKGLVLATKGELDQWVLSCKVAEPLEKVRKHAIDVDLQVRELQQRVVRMKQLCDEAVRLRAEWRASRDKFYHNIQLVIPALNGQIQSDAKSPQKVSLRVVRTRTGLSKTG